MMTTPRPRISTLAFLAFVLAILSFILSFVAGAPALLLGYISARRIERRPDFLGGLGYARTAMTLALIGSCISGLIYLVPSALAQTSAMNLRARCAANLKGIATSMCVYGNENDDVFPLVPAPEKMNTYTVEFGQNSGKKNIAEAFVQMQDSKSVAGNIPAVLWVMVVTQQVSPKSYICPEDPFADTPAKWWNANKEYYLNFQAANQLSYSISYPWYLNSQTKKNSGANWWRNNTDSSLPILSDMAPLNGTGRPARDVTKDHSPLISSATQPENGSTTEPATAPAYARTNMPFSHGGQGVNVAFADAHVEWSRSPKIGQSMENIFTSGEVFKETRNGLRSSYEITFGGKAPTPGAIEPITTHATPFDTVQVPLRDGNTGEIK